MGTLRDVRFGGLYNRCGARVGVDACATTVALTVRWVLNNPLSGSALMKHRLPLLRRCDPCYPTTTVSHPEALLLCPLTSQCVRSRRLRPGLDGAVAGGSTAPVRRCRERSPTWLCWFWDTLDHLASMRRLWRVHSPFFPPRSTHASTVVPCSIGSLRLHSFGPLGGDGAIEISADLTIPEGDGKLVVTVVPWPIMEAAPRGSQLSS